MANRFRRGRSAKRRKYWQTMVVEDVGTNTAAGTIRDVAILAVTSSSDIGFTVLRILGAVYMGLQAATVSTIGLYWGIYQAQSGGGGSLRFDPSVEADISEQNWMHWRAFHSFGPADEPMTQDVQAVDMKTMRKITGGDELHWVGACPNSAWHSSVALRCLSLHA